MTEPLMVLSLRVRPPLPIVPRTWRGLILPVS